MLISPLSLFFFFCFCVNCSPTPRFYTDFRDLKRELEVSQYSEAASELPPKHPFGLKFKMAFQRKQTAMKSEVEVNSICGGVRGD